MSQYKIGTVNVTNGSAVVVGVDTEWLANAAIGDIFMVLGDNTPYDIASVDTDLQVTLSSTYAGVTATDKVYALTKDFTSPDGFPYPNQRDIETAVIMRRAITGIQAVLDGPRVLGFKNEIINPKFDIWQRGVSFVDPVSGTFTADRFRVQYNGSGMTRTISRQPFTLGQTDVPGEPEFYFRHDVSVAGTGQTFHQLLHKIEHVRKFAGQNAVVSFYAKANGSLNLEASTGLYQNFGTGGSPSAQIKALSFSDLALTTSWKRLSTSGLMPSISSKTIGTTGDDSLILVLGFPLNTIAIIDIAMVVCEPGLVVTPFEHRPIGLELSLAQRFFQKTFPQGTTPAQAAGAIGAIGYRVTNSGAVLRDAIWEHKVTMRKKPTIITYNPVSANTNWYNSSDGNDSGAGAVDGISDDSRTILRNSQVATDGPGELCQIHATADAEI